MSSYVHRRSRRWGKTKKTLCPTYVTIRKEKGDTEKIRKERGLACGNGKKGEVSMTDLGAGNLANS